MTAGAKWAWEVVHRVRIALSLAGLFIGVWVSGLLIHRSALFLGTFAAVVLLLILGEGAYKTSATPRVAPSRAATREARRRRRSESRWSYAELRAALLAKIAEARSIVNELAQYPPVVTDYSSERKLEERREEAADWIEGVEEALEHYLQVWCERFAREPEPQRVEDFRPPPTAPELCAWLEGKVRTLEGMCEDDYAT
jgi:hypothetical protein